MTDKQEQEMALELKEQSKGMVAHDDGPNAMFLDSCKFTQALRAASMLAKSSLVPDSFRGNPSNCMVALNMASRLGIDPFMVFQNVYVIHGKPGIQAQLVIAMVNKSGPFEGPIEYEYKGTGDNMSCTAFGIMRGTGRRCEATVDWNLVKAEKWDSKNGSKWRTMPEQMFAYRAATFLARRYCPEVLMGLYTTDELSDIKANDDSKRQPKDTVSVAIEQLKEKPQSESEKPVQNKKPVQKKESKQVKVQDNTKGRKIIEKAKEILETESEVEFVQELADTIRDAKKEGVTSFWLECAMKEVGIEPHKISTQTQTRVEDLQERISIFLG